MADGSSIAQARTAASIADIGEDAWQACARAADPVYHPFTDYRFLSSLEDSGSVAAEEGWGPRHLVLEDGAGRIVGAAPMYLKGHSYGEYVFDHAWADAYERAGGRYYPKLQMSVPFTPATGPRLLAADPERRRMLASAAVQAAAQMGVSSLHATFLTAEDGESLKQAGCLGRIDRQFHWRDAGYGTFDGFLDSLASRKRKALRKERAAALAESVDIEWVGGSDLREAHWDAFWEFYQDTGARKWGTPYLTRKFFDCAHETMRDDMLLVLAVRNGRPVAGA
ncbi:MAG: GNAT family N-acetyltransferase, partial [Pseudomonadota bacterium]